MIPAISSEASTAYNTLPSLKINMSPIQKKVAFVAIPAILIVGALPVAEGGPMTMAACIATCMGLTSGGFRQACVAACTALFGVPSP